MLGVCAELDPPFLCSTGWRLSLGSGVDGTVCAFARGAKNCKIARAAGAGPFCGPPGLDARTWLVDLCGQERRGELSTWWLPGLLCVEPCSTHVVEVVCSCTVQSDSQTTGPGNFSNAWNLACVVACPCNVQSGGQIAGPGNNSCTWQISCFSMCGSVRGTFALSRSCINVVSSCSKCFLECGEFGVIGPVCHCSLLEARYEHCVCHVLYWCEPFPAYTSQQRCGPCAGSGQQCRLCRRLCPGLITRV